MSTLKGLSRRRFLNLGIAAGASLMLPPGFIPAARSATPLPALKESEALVAFAHSGPISDEGWTWSHDQGMKAVQAAFPQIKTVFVENVPYSADATRTFRQFVSDGADMVFATSIYGDFLAEVASRSPDTAFLEAVGQTVTDNLGWYYLEHWFPTYVIGVAAGLLSKKGKLGYISSFPIPAVMASTNSFLMGARTTNPNIQLQVISINSWFDPQAEAQAATALIDNGCDFLFGFMDDAAYLKVAEERGVWAAMWNTDLRRYGENAYVSSVVIDFKKFYLDQVGKRLAGTWVPGGHLLPFGDGIDRDAWGKNVPKEVQDAADAARTKIIGGWNPFTGELKDASGTVRVAAGQTMDGASLYNWNWVLEGISGLTN